MVTHLPVHMSKTAADPSTLLFVGGGFNFALGNYYNVSLDPKANKVCNGSVHFL